MIMQEVNEVSEAEEGSWLSEVVSLIISEIFIVLHVVNVDPLSIDGYLIFNIALKGLNDILEGAVTPLALVPAEGPLGGQHRSANQTVILSYNTFWVLGRQHDIDVP
jgi:hypothetical protein